MKNRTFVFVSISVVSHIILLVLFVYKSNELNVFSLIGFMYLPILLNLIFCGIQTYISKKETYIKTAVIYTGISFCYWFVNTVYLSQTDKIALIYERSMQYSSNEISISQGNPFVSGIIYLIIAFLLYWFIGKIAGGHVKKRK